MPDWAKRHYTFLLSIKTLNIKNLQSSKMQEAPKLRIFCEMSIRKNTPCHKK